MVSTFWFILPICMPLPVLMKLNTESALLDLNNNNGMTLLGPAEFRRNASGTTTFL
jgi:hypothetical protein